MGLDKFRHKFRTEIFDAKASNKARVWVNGVGKGLLDGKNHNTDKSDTLFGS